MGLEPVEPTAPGTSSRRARREAELAARARARSRTPNRARWIPRLALLGALAGITVVLPLTANVSPGSVANAVAADSGLPATIEAVTTVRVATVPPPAIAATDAMATRSDIAASRSEERDPLPGCDGTRRAAGANGQLKTSDLCTLWDGQLQLRGDAASSLAELNLAFRARFGRDVCLTDGYRTIGEQRSLKATKGGLAAVPGRSNHGWGLAVDLCSNETRGAGWTWIRENGAIYGWENPDWAMRGGSGPYEPWHWEYTRGVAEDGEYYSS